jgi:hypothetical protein
MAANVLYAARGSDVKTSPVTSFLDQLGELVLCPAALVGEPKEDGFIGAGREQDRRRLLEVEAWHERPTLGQGGGEFPHVVGADIGVRAFAGLLQLTVAGGVRLPPATARARRATSERRPAKQATASGTDAATRISVQGGRRVSGWSPSPPRTPTRMISLKSAALDG